jgi:hypothetical protein
MSINDSDRFDHDGRGCVQAKHMNTLEIAQANK